jgi:hypothetical protein
MGVRDRVKWWDGTDWRPVLAQPAVGFVPVGDQPTVTTITSIPTSVNGSATFNITGTVKTTTGANASGTVQAQWLNGSTWTNAGTAVSVVSGGYTLTGLSETATRSWRVSFTASAGFLNSVSTTKTVTRKVLTSFTTVYNPTWVMSYAGDNSQRGADPLYQGYFSSTWGNQKSAMRFPYSTIRSDIGTDGTVTKVELYLNAEHWGPDSGGTVRIRTHTDTASTAPTSYASVSGVGGSEDTTAWSTKTGAKWCDITSLGTSAWKTTLTGCVLVSSSTATEYYGYFTGSGTGKPQLRVTYEKWV